MKKHQGDLTSYPANFLDCRPGNSGHRWKWETDYKILRNSKGDISEFSRKRRCTRCQVKRVTVYDGNSGRVLRRWYDYGDAPEYTIDSTKLEIEPGMVVLEALRRALKANHVEEDTDATI